MIKEILLIGNPVLREKSKSVNSFNEELYSLIHDLKDTLIDFQKRKEIGRGIAAPQIGVLKKVIYLNLPDRSFVLVNPEITWKSNEMFEVWDSCFSFDVAFFVKTQRYKSIKVNYQNEKGISFEETFGNDLSELLQHEIDHLHGILATDHLKSNKDIILRAEWEKRYK
ncbi:MAG TPA: formylmethionine deformylase [Bacteroidales bacterium]|nr:formylmethionine deformylase [Bacteroidales bacterium]